MSINNIDEYITDINNLLDQNKTMLLEIESYKNIIKQLLDNTKLSQDQEKNPLMMIIYK